MISSISDKIILDNGLAMPGYGFGVYKMSGQEALASLPKAFACGYRYIDTASFYENEAEVGKFIQTCGLSRDDIFIVSKIWPTQFRKPIEALDTSLRLLKLDYLDGYLLHWPGLDETLRLKAYESLLREQEKGKIRVLGVSNFLEPHLQGLFADFGFWTPLNQIEVHPNFQQRELCSFCAAHGIQVISWSPLGRGNAVKLPLIESIADFLHKTPAQIILRWHIQKNLVPIPKSTHAERIRENALVFDFCLDEEQMRSIDSLDLPNSDGRTGKDPYKWPPMD